MLRLDDKIAVITGGSRGIGKSICLKLAEHGANVAFIYTSDEKKLIILLRKYLIWAMMFQPTDVTYLTIRKQKKP